MYCRNHCEMSSGLQRDATIATKLGKFETNLKICTSISGTYAVSKCCANLCYAKYKNEHQIPIIDKTYYEVVYRSFVINMSNETVGN